MISAEGDEKFVACTCNVGDSLAYVYSPSQGHVREITQGSHDIQSNRDMRDALGIVLKSISSKTETRTQIPFFFKVPWARWTESIQN